MAMSHDMSIELTINGNEDYSEAVKRIFLLAQEEDANYGHKYDYFSKEDNRYTVRYSERGYYEEGPLWNQCCELAEESGIRSFFLNGDIQNEGSGGNYSESLSAEYSFGKLVYRYVDNDSSKVNGARKRTQARQLKSRAAFAEEIAESKEPLGEIPPSDSFLPFVEQVPDSQKKLLKNNTKKVKPNHFDIRLKSALYDDAGTPSADHDLLKGIQLYYYDLLSPDYQKKLEQILSAADSYVELFRDETKDLDRESELRQGLIRRGYSLHVFRSFVWTAIEYCKSKKLPPEELKLEELLALCRFILDQGGATWKACSKTTKRIGSVLLTKSELRVTYCDIVNPITCEASNLSYIKLVESLASLEPAMEAAFDYLLLKDDERTEAERVMEEILAVWCAYTLAAKEPFSVVKGPDSFTPEKCHILIRDDTVLSVTDYSFYTVGQTCIACTARGEEIAFPDGIVHICIPELQSLWSRYEIAPDTYTYSRTRQYLQSAKRIIFPKSFCPRDGCIIVPISFRNKELVSKGNQIFIDRYTRQLYDPAVNTNNLDQDSAELIKVWPTQTEFLIK